VIGGILGLCLIQGTSSILNRLNLTHLVQHVEELVSPWRSIPGQLINVVFACLFLGVALPKFSELWRRSGTQVVYGQMVAWGQYVVGLGRWVFVLGGIYTDLPALFAGILPVGFEGGHGTAAGMGPVFKELGWENGQDLALSSATFGILCAIVVGTILVNWAIRRATCKAETMAFSQRTRPSRAFSPWINGLAQASYPLTRMRLRASAYIWSWLAWPLVWV